MFIIGLIIFIYGYYIEIRDSYGKILIMVLSSHMVLLLAVFLSRIMPGIFKLEAIPIGFIIFFVLANGGFFTGILWLSVLVLHNFRRLK